MRIQLNKPFGTQFNNAITICPNFLQMVYNVDPSLKQCIYNQLISLLRYFVFFPGECIIPIPLCLSMHYFQLLVFKLRQERTKDITKTVVNVFEV